MYCNKCGKQIEEGMKFCSGCGVKIEQKKCESTVPEETANTSCKQKNIGYKIAVIAMAVIIAVMGIFIGVDISKDSTSSSASGTVQDDNVEIAISALKQHWRTIFADAEETDGHFEITHTQVLTIDADRKSELASVYDKADDIKYIVQFDLHTDYYGTAPYYPNIRYEDTVIIFKDGSTEIIDLLKNYSARTYSYDYSDFLVKVEDYGSSFNQVFDLD